MEIIAKTIVGVGIIGATLMTGIVWSALLATAQSIWAFGLAH